MMAINRDQYREPRTSSDTSEISILQDERPRKRCKWELLGDKGLQRIRFVVLDQNGRQTKTRHIFGFGPDKSISHPHLNYRVFSASYLAFEKMLEVAEIDEAFAVSHSYAVSLPCGHLTDISTKTNWKRAMTDLERWMSRETRSSPCPQIIKLGPAAYLDSQHGSHAQDLPIPLETSARAPAPSPTPSLNISDWEAACNFFCHGQDDLTGMRLHGFADPLSPQLMIRIYRFLHSFATGNRIVSDEPFRNKRDFLAKTAVIALCWATFEACDAAFHDATGEFGSQATTIVEQRYGLKCTCRKDSLTKLVVSRMTHGITVILAKDKLDCEEWLELVSSTFVRVENTTSPSHWMAAASFNGDRISIPSFMMDSLSGSAQDWMAKISNTSFVSAEPDRPITLQELGVRNPTSLTIRSRQIPNQDRMILVLGLEDLDIGVFDNFFSSVERFELQNVARDYHRVEVRRMIRASTVYCDAKLRKIVSNDVLDLVKSISGRDELGNIASLRE